MGCPQGSLHCLQASVRLQCLSLSSKCPSECLDHLSNLRGMVMETAESLMSQMCDLYVSVIFRKVFSNHDPHERFRNVSQKFLKILPSLFQFLIAVSRFATLPPSLVINGTPHSDDFLTVSIEIRQKIALCFASNSWFIFVAFLRRYLFATKPF